MALRLIATRCWLLLSLLAGEAKSNTEGCHNFLSLKISERDKTNHWCPAEECSDGQVYGTDAYVGISDICLAALHAGVITNLGTNITVTRQPNIPGIVYGTAKNRIVSQHRSVKCCKFQAYKVESTVQEKGVIGEVLMVHNSASDGVLRFACLSQDNVSPISPDDLKTWDYQNLGNINSLSGTHSPQMMFELDMTENQHAIRILGSQRDQDVLAVVQYPDAEYQSKVATVRVSVNENVPIHLLKSKDTMSDMVHFKHLPGSWTSKHVSNLSSLLTPAHLHDAGIYVVHESKNSIGNKHGAYFDLVVRECEAGFFGSGCSQECPACQNGGQCHARRGSCLCPPGFIGMTCQFACLPGWFGNKCQFRCDIKTVGFRGTKNDVEQNDGRCVGLTICLPPPYGCSCATGFTHHWTDLGLACVQECPKGYFGADCNQRCLGCVEDKCDPFSGTCMQGCTSATECRQGPSPPHVIIISQRRGYKAHWIASDPDVIYFLSHQLIPHSNCTLISTERLQLHYDKLVSPPYNVSNLLPHASYNVCIVASSSEGLSLFSCSTVETPAEVPDVNITKLSCEEKEEELVCKATVNTGCENYNGPGTNITFFLNTMLPCSHPHTTLQDSVLLENTIAEVKFPNYLAGEQYRVRAVVGNTAGAGNKACISYFTHSKAPPPVQNVTYIILSDTALQLLWNDPCPSNGEITDVDVTMIGNLFQTCATTDLFDHCRNITGLKLGEIYTYKMKEQNKAGLTYEQQEKIIFERMPSPPQAIKIMPGSDRLNLSLVLPDYTGGILKNCTISLTYSKTCNISLEKGASTANCIIDDLKEGKKYKATAHCCNTRFCSQDFHQPVATKPIPPQLSGPFSIVRKGKSTITFRLPAIDQTGDGNNSLIVIVIVQLEAQIKNPNLSSAIQMLVDKHYRMTRRKRNTIEKEDQCQNQEWVAAELKQNQEEFVVGDGKLYNGFLNCPLKTSQAYTIGTMGVNELMGIRTYSNLMMENGIVVVMEPSAPNLLLLLLLLLILPVLGLLAYFRLHNWPTNSEWIAKFRTDASQEVLAQPCESSNVSTNHNTYNEILTNDLPDFINEYEELNEAIYENLNPKESGTTISSHVPSVEVEAYLNKVIGSREAGDDFRTVPSTLTKSMTTAQRPENKAKNRFKNNHPYDDTRVVLSCVDKDPASDYINANHVEGYGNMRYIAAQGPKDTRVSTVAHFWRMVVEQNITAIIMVANFVEMGKKKVGEYFTPGQTLNFDGFEVMVNSKEELSHFTLSSLLLRWKEETYQVQHYHYTQWPDHGIPTEAKSIAQMLDHFQFHHTQGGTVIHCSAGIGRTGTVLQVLLMSEMLKLKSYLNPIEVLGRLRMSRARLVENEAQYNLSLEILEEILFGKKTIVSPDDILNHLDEYYSVSRIQYARAKALPSPLSFTTSDMPIFQHLNRNQSVLPADSNRCYLQPRSGVDSWLSQYINAIRVPGSNREDLMIATEHPLPHTIASFWRLVIETGCTIIIFVNSFENQIESEFPTMLMEPGEVWHVDSYELQVKEAVPYGTWLKQSSLSITSNKDWLHSVDVYQCVDWPVSSQLPPSPYILLTVAELLQTPRTLTSGPPLLCCSDGVTGCGIVAAMTLIVEHLRREQMVDVYRTVVKLLRARQQFITNEEQFHMLYTSTATYLEEYSSYGNFQ